MGMVVMGKLETGKLAKGRKLVLMPNKKTCKVAQLWFEDNEVKSAIAGQNLKVIFEKKINYSVYLSSHLLNNRSRRPKSDVLLDRFLCIFITHYHNNLYRGVLCKENLNKSKFWLFWFSRIDHVCNL